MVPSTRLRVILLLVIGKSVEMSPLTVVAFTSVFKSGGSLSVMLPFTVPMARVSVQSARALAVPARIHRADRHAAGVRHDLDAD